MMWDEWYNFQQRQEEESDDDSHPDYDFCSVLSKPKDYYKILDVDYDAPEEVIRSNYIRLALKWHPDKKKNEDCATSRFQEINEAYMVQDHRISRIKRLWSRKLDSELYGKRPVLIDPVKRREYDKKGMLYAYDSNIIDYLNRYKSLILTCNGLGMKCSI